MQRLYHPSNDIFGEVNDYLNGLEVVVAVTGSVAIYKSVDLVRWFLRRSARVNVVMSKDAANLVSPTLFEWASGGEVYTEFGGEVGHITLARRASAVVVAPATLTTISKIARGILDTPVALIAVSALGYRKPVIVAPAMHRNLYDTSQYAEAVNSLERQGVKVVEPYVKGSVARFPSVHTIGRVAAALARRGSEDLKGVKVLVTAGATREWIDKVRFISNPSSGAMGVEVALEMWARGANVDLVAGGVSVELPHMVRIYKVDSTEEMAQTVASLTGRKRYDVIVGAGAPVDFKPSERFKGKIKSGVKISLELEPTPKVLASIKQRPRVLVAFAAEHVDSVDELAEPALDKMGKYKADMVVANIVGVPGVGFSSPKLRVLALGSQGRILFKGDIHKEMVAALIADEVSKLLKGT